MNTSSQSAGAPLEGLRVVELAGIGPAPFACLLLAELGADVVRIDRPDAATRPIGSLGLDRSRPAVALDLKSERGVELVRRLAADADVFVEGLRPGATERLGLGPDDLLARNPRLVYGRMTGWGQDGPLARRAGHDIDYAAISGVLHLIGGADKPRQPVNLAADFGGGSLYLLVGILSALHARGRTGRGQVVDAAMVDGAASLATMIYAMFGAGAWRDEREANLLDGGRPFYDTYRCADGRFVAVGALEPQFYAELLERLGLELEGDQYDWSHWPEHRAAFETVFATRTRDEWDEVFRDTDACVAPVLSLAEAPHHPHLAARGVFADVDGVAQPRVAPRFSDTPGREPEAARRAGGEPGRAALRARGIDDAEIDDLLRDGVLVDPDDGAA